MCGTIVRLMSQCFSHFQICIGGESAKCNEREKKQIFHFFSHFGPNLATQKQNFSLVKPEQERFLLFLCIRNCLLYSRFDNTIRKNQIRHQSNVCIANCRHICCAVKIFVSQCLDGPLILLRE